MNTKEKLQNLSLILKARAKKQATPPKHGFGSHEEIIPVHTKSGKIAMQKRKVGITKKKSPKSKKKPVVAKKKPSKPIAEATTKKIKDIKIPEKWKDQGDPIIASQNYEARKLRASGMTLVSNESLKNPKAKPKKHPVWLEEALKNILASVRLGVSEIENPIRRVDAMVRYAFPLLKKNKIPFSLMLNIDEYEDGKLVSTVRDITESDLKLASFRNPLIDKQLGVNPFSYRDSHLPSLKFLDNLRIYVSKKNLPKATKLMDKPEIPMPVKEIPESFYNKVMKLNLSSDSREKFKKTYEPMDFSFKLGKNRNVSVKGFRNVDFGYMGKEIKPSERLGSFPRNTTFDELTINGKKLTREYLLEKGKLDNFKDFNNLMDSLIEERGRILNFTPTDFADAVVEAVNGKKNEPSPQNSYKKGNKKENTDRRKKFAQALGLKTSPTPFKNWIKDKRIGNINGSKTDYFGFNDNIFNSIGEAKEQKIGWNNLVLSPNLKKGDHIFFAPIDPFTKEIGAKGHTPYADVFVANSTTDLYKLGIENGVSNMGYGVFVIDTKNKTIEKMDIHALNKTTLEEAKRESEQIAKYNPFSLGNIKEQNKNMVESLKPASEIKQTKVAENIAEQSKGMTIEGKQISDRDSKDFLEKYSKQLSGQYKYKKGSDSDLDEKGKASLLEKLLDGGIDENSISLESKEDYYLRHLLDNNFIQSEKTGHNKESGYAKWKFKVKPEHLQGLKLYKELISGK